jgi:nucleotide-binding universal stress UspA family protein
MSARHPQAGELIGGFRLEAPLHRGGMAQLWRVTRPDDPTPMVMKVPLLRAGENPVSIVSFEVEQMILPRLAGVHVPRFVAAGDFDQPFLVMEYIAGETLKSRLDQLPLPWPEVAAIGGKVATALHDIHRQHVIHLDLKPSNIMLRGRPPTPADVRHVARKMADDAAEPISGARADHFVGTGEAVLIDFGLARHEQLPDLLAEEIRSPLGTGPYIAPEQLMGERGDPRSDLFALGVLLYFFATGERPFGDPEAFREWRRRLYRDPVPPRRRQRELPPWLQEVILRCLEVDPNDRYPTAAQLAVDLNNPAQVILTARAERMERSGALTVARRWLKARRMQPVRRPTCSRQLADAPIVMAAVDLSPGMERLGEALRLAVLRVLQSERGARLACVNVMKLSRVALDRFEDEQGRNIHLQRLAELRHWAQPLPVPTNGITYHVLEAVDPAAAVIDYARNNHVDHIVLGARGSSSLRRYLGSVSSQVVAEAPCTVTVVRAE